MEKRERELDVRREEERDAEARETAVKMRRLFGAIVEVKQEASSVQDASLASSSSLPSALSVSGARHIVRERKRLNARDTHSEGWCCRPAETHISAHCS